jgi:hypothetical protein
MKIIFQFPEAEAALRDLLARPQEEMRTLKIRSAGIVLSRPCHGGFFGWAYTPATPCWMHSPL